MEYDLDVAQRRNRGWGDVGWFGATMSRLMEKGMKLLEPHLGYTPDELVEAMEQTVARQVRLSGEDSGPAANNRLDLAEALVAADRPVEARLLLEEVLAACRRNRGDEDEQTFTAELLLARSLASEGMLDEALSLATHAREGRRQIKGMKGSKIVAADEMVRSIDQARKSDDD